MDGIALVPGHPLPVVFPRADGLPPPLRFVQKFTSGQARLARAKSHESNNPSSGLVNELGEAV